MCVLIDIFYLNIFYFKLQICFSVKLYILDITASNRPQNLNVEKMNDIELHTYFEFPLGLNKLLIYLSTTYAFKLSQFYLIRHYHIKTGH